MKKIKVLHLSEDLKVGGLENVIAAIMRGLDEKRYVPEAWCVARGGEIAEELSREGQKVRVLGIGTYHNPLNFLKLASFLKKGEFDIVHTHGYFASTIGRISAKLARVPVIISHVHSTYWDYKERNLLIEKALSNFTDKIICCSDAVKDFVVSREKIEIDKTVTIYNGVEERNVTRSAEDIKRSLGVNEDDIIITTVGSLFPHKGQKYLLEAIHKLKEKHTGIKCLLAGDGPSRGELERYSRDLGISSDVKFLGTRKDVTEILTATDIFALPSSGREGLGITILEAMSCGKPVVASRLGGIPEVVSDGSSGYLTSPKDVIGLCDRLDELIIDKDKRTKFGEEGRRIFEKKFRAKTMLSSIEGLYEECLSKKVAGKVRVLYVHNKTGISGGEKSLLNLWRNLDNEQLETYLIIPGQGDFSTEAEDVVKNIGFLDVPRLDFGNFFKILGTIFKLREHIIKNKIDIIHSYTPRNNFISALAAKITGRPVIWHERNLIFADEKDLTKKFLFLPDSVICNSSAVAERFKGANGTPSNVNVILNGVDLDRFTPGISGEGARKEFGVTGKKIVGMISNLNKRKRVDYFLEIASRLAIKFDNIMFMVVGEEFPYEGGDRLRKLKEKAGELGVKDKVIFTGFRKDIPEILASFDISAHTTVKEACSRVIIESMAMGKPVVAIDDGGNPELVENGVTGTLVGVNDTAAFVAAVEDLLSDENKRKEFGEKARTRAERLFNIKRNAKETEQLYSSLLEKA